LSSPEIGAQKFNSDPSQARTILGIPVPKVLAWSGKAGNPVGSEYILMEEATGRQLGEVWDDLKLADKLKIVEEIVAIEEKLLSLSFTRYVCQDVSDDGYPSLTGKN
jgi:hypothetical protein